MHASPLLPPEEDGKGGEGGGGCSLNCLSYHRGPAQCVCVADCYYIVNALDLPFASPIAIYR